MNLDDLYKNFPTHWGNADVRGALWAMQGHSCAYCDRELPSNDRGDVEHFRPKSIHWWLAYTFENYLLSCSVCNSSYKKTKFLTSPPDAYVDYTMRDQLDQEPRLFIDPVADPIDGWFSLSAKEWKSRGLQITFSSGLGNTERERCETTFDIFNLNGDSGLLRARQDVAHRSLRLLKKIRNGDADSLRELKEKAIRFCPHSFVVREIILSFKRRPEYLPSYEDEVKWLVKDLIGTLLFALNTLKKKPTNTTEKNQRDRCAWALAVLMKDPPALSSAEIRDLLQRKNVLDVVEPFYQRL